MLECQGRTIHSSSAANRVQTLRPQWRVSVQHSAWNSKRAMRWSSDWAMRGPVTNPLRQTDATLPVPMSRTCVRLMARSLAAVKAILLRRLPLPAHFPQRVAVNSASYSLSASSTRTLPGVCPLKKLRSVDFQYLYGPCRSSDFWLRLLDIHNLRFLIYSQSCG